MKRTFPTLALIGVAALGSFSWQQTGRADEGVGGSEQARATDVATDTPALQETGPAPVVQAGPYADAIHELLATAPGPERDAAAERFRSHGPAGYAALHESLAIVIEHYRAAKSFGFEQGAAEHEPLVRLLDQVAAQRDAYAAGLYWYTDLDEAKAQAQETGKPILSLRMLGNLDEEYSCANSRFFRTVLYADEALGDTLREKFVLHWQSVRPVPVITIDMGDGRVLRRTITGNSCHLVLDPQGQPVDVIPGLYGPRTFEQQVTRGAELIAWLHETDEDQRDALVTMYHTKSAIALDNRWLELTPNEPAPIEPETFATEADRLFVAQNDNVEPFDIDVLWAEMGVDAIIQTQPERLPTAAEAATRVVGKSSVEAVFIQIIGPNTSVTALTSPDETSAEVWDAVAAYYAEGAVLDDASRALMREKTITAEQAMAVALSKSRVEDPLLAMVLNFQGAIALDTARNEHLLHRQIHQWFIEGEAPMDADALTSRVYAELFLTPDEDPWLGLVPADTYSALDVGGLETGE